MKRNFSETILDLDGDPVVLGLSMEAFTRALNAAFQFLPKASQDALNTALEKEARKPLTLGAACVGALMSVYEGEQTMDDSVRLARMMLAVKINAGGIVDIEPVERDLIKPLLKKKWAGSILIPVVAAQLLEKDAPEPLKSVA
ncbi:MAG: hypothetical protein ACTS6J_02110 [Burkholderiales bacterium]